LLRLRPEQSLRSQPAADRARRLHNGGLKGDYRRMSPPSEQLIRDYLSRLSAAARGRLGTEDRRTFVKRTREFIEQTAPQPGLANSMQIAALLAQLGDPGVLVDQEVARLSAERGELAPPPVAVAGRLAAIRRRRPASWHWPSMSGDPDLQTRLLTVAATDLNGAVTEPTASTATDAAHTGTAAPAQNPPRRNSQPPIWVPRQPAAADEAMAAWAGPALDSAAVGGPDQPAAAERKPNWPSVVARSPATAQPAAAPTVEWPDVPAYQAKPGAGMAAALLRQARANPVAAVAVILLGLGGAAFPPVWLLGAAVAIASRVWDYRDKWLGLAGPVLLLVLGTFLGVTLGSRQTSLGGYVHEGWIYADVLSRVGAVLGAYYLAWRVGHPRPASDMPPWNRPHHVG
jgi:hypothetical protein